VLVESHDGKAGPRGWWKIQGQGGLVTNSNLPIHIYTYSYISYNIYIYISLEFPHIQMWTCVYTYIYIYIIYTYIHVLVNIINPELWLMVLIMRPDRCWSCSWYPCVALPSWWPATLLYYIPFTKWLKCQVFKRKQKDTSAFWGDTIIWQSYILKSYT